MKRKNKKIKDDYDKRNKKEICRKEEKKEKYKEKKSRKKKDI